METLLSHLKLKEAGGQIVSKRAAYSFSHLDRISDIWATRIFQHLGEDVSSWPDALPIISERSVEYIQAALACWKLGIAIVPIALGTPQSRLRHIMQDLGSQFVINLTDSSLPEYILQLNFEGELPKQPEYPEKPLKQTGMAYIIYTSGTTGTPKGCVVGVESLLPIVDSFVQYYGLDAQSRVTFCANTAFDAAMLEWLPALTVGASVYLVSDDILLNSSKLVEFYRDNSITFSWLPTPVAELLMADDELDLPESLQILQTAGQRLSKRPPKNWHVRVENAYGPTETTVIATSGVVHSVGSSLPDIGRPLPGVECFIVDDNLHPVAIGEIGELLITGVGVSRGYLYKPALNEKCFIEFTCVDGHTTKAYRSGDLCRLNAHGNIEYVSRKDKQLKLNGYRIESDEVIHCLLKVEHVQQAHVMVRRVGLRDVLVAYVVMASGIQKDRTQIREALGRNLPSYMIPDYIVSLDHFPLTANHKLDEDALPSPQVSNHNSTAEEELLTQNEQDFLALFRLNIGGEVGWNESFYEAGGNSIAAISISAQVQKEFALTLPFGLFKSQGTPAKIWQAIQSKTFDVERIESYLDTTKPYMDTPLSSSQRSIWFFANMDTEDRAYHAKSQLMLEGDVNAQAVAFAIQKVVERHSIFRSTFIPGDGEGVQRVYPQYSVTLAEFDFSDLPTEQSEQKLQEIVQETLNQPFDLAQLPLVRWGLVKLSSNKSVLVHIEHHLVHDGWSYNLFLKDFLFYYRAFVEGSSAELEFPSQYADYCITQAQWLKSNRPEKDLSYWKKQLGDAPAALNLPSHSTDTDDVRAGQTLRIELPRHKWEAVERLAEQRGETPFSIMLAAYYVMLSRFSSDSDICVGSAFANRQWINADSIIGMMINTVALRNKLETTMTLEQVLSGTFGVVQQAQRHESLPFEYLVNAINPDRSAGVNPFFQVFFGFHDSPMPELILPGIKQGKVLEAIDSRAAKFDLSVVVIPRKGQLGEGDPIHVLWEFKSAKFPNWLIENMIEDYLGILDCVLTTPQLPLVELKVNTPQLSGPELPYQSDSVYNALVKQAELMPQAIALSCQETKYSYSEIVQEVQRKAAYLVNLGVKPNGLIGISINRDSNFLLWMLACQAAGVGYVPIDPEYPQQRKQYIIEHSKIKCLVSYEQVATVERIDPHASADTEFKPVAIDGQWPMYCIYTSGSTGLPKGVVISYSAFSNFIQAMKQQFQLNEQHKWLAITSFSFDISTLEVYLPLMSGAQVQLATQQETRDLTRLTQYLESHEVTHCQATPSTWHALSGLGWQPHSKQCILTGGEALDAALAKVLSQNGNLCFNMYGPTETTVWSSVKQVSAKNQVISLGKPIANTQFWILDEHMNPVPSGTVGELWISGASLATGYLNSELLTQERFVDNQKLNQRVYKTGDLVSIDSKGELYYFGRKDHQVKVAGHRIELEEIEQVIKQLEQVQQVAVVTRDSSGTTQIVAFVNSSVDEALLREHCRHKLPTYMVPHQFLYLNALPLTPNNKIDKKALPQQICLDEVIHRSNTPTEAKLSKIFCAHLNLEKVDTQRHFYKLGGNSLMAMRVCVSIEKELGIQVKVLDLIELGSLSALAAFIDALHVTDSNFPVAEELVI